MGQAHCDDIMLSVIVPTYNHEKYIVKALDSIKMQKTQYRFEVLVGEDASTDGTRKVLEEYEQLNPGFLTVFYREKNLRLDINSPGNGQDLRHKAKGKYLITLEGDDFWTDEYKIETQVSFLEKHSDVIAVAHNCVVVDENSVPNGENYPECKNFEYTMADYFNNIFPGQLATVMTRNFVKYDLCDYSILEKRLSPGDSLMYYMLLCSGRVCCLQKSMSAYRHVVSSGSSYSANIKYDYNKELHWYKEFMNYAKNLGNAQGYRYTELNYVRALKEAFIRRKISFVELIKCMADVEHKWGTLLLYFRRLFHVKHS